MSADFPMSWRLGWPAACSALALAAGCGESPKRVVAPPPRIPHAVASELAARADAVAAALARGDACTARQDASVLARTAGASKLEAVLREKLDKAVGELVSALPRCAPPPPPAPPPAPPPSPPAAPAKTPPAKKRGHEKRKHRKQGHERGRGGGGETGD